MKIKARSGPKLKDKTVTDDAGNKVKVGKK